MCVSPPPPPAPSRDPWSIRSSTLRLPLFRAPPRPHARGTPSAPLSCHQQTPELVSLSACCVQNSERRVGLKKRQCALGMVSALSKTTIYPPPQVCMPSLQLLPVPSSGSSTRSQPSLRRRASLPGADPQGGSRPLVTWHPVGGLLPTKPSVRNGEDSQTCVPQPQGSQTQAIATSPPLVHAAGLAHTHGVQRSLYSLAMVSMPPARATAT